MKNQRARKVANYVIPTVLSQCAFFLFTIVDGVFVGNGVGTDALGAVNLAMPFIMVIGAAFMLTTIGGVTVAAIRLGRGDIPGANQAFMHSLGCTAVIATVFSVIGIMFTRPLAALLGADWNYIDMVCDYLLWYSIFTLPAAISTTLQGFGRNDGAPVFVMASTIVSTALNIFLDWLFVFPLQKGIAGAAIATGISQVAGLAIIVVHFVKKRGVLRIAPVKFDAALVGKILTRGLPEMLSQLTTPVTILCMNLTLIKYIGDDGVNAYSIIGYIISFAYAIFMGVSEGMQPLFGRSYGDQNEEDLHYFLCAGVIVSFGGSAVVYGLIIALGGVICAMFGGGGRSGHGDNRSGDTASRLGVPVRVDEYDSLLVPVFHQAHARIRGGECPARLHPHAAVHRADLGGDERRGCLVRGRRGGAYKLPVCDIHHALLRARRGTLQ